jgi:hypothetical protein
MKKTLGFLAINLLLIATILKAQVSVEAFPINPQSGPHNYFGVRVTLAQTYGENVTVTGFIYDEGNGANTNHPFSLTVAAGDLTAETAANFYETDPTATAVADLGTLVVGYAGVPITYEANGCILKFNSAADLITVINQLDAANDAHNDDYDSQYPNLTEDQLDDMDEQTGFDEFQKFRDFENMFGGFCSKRSEIESVETAWLANNFTGTDPDNIDLTFDDAENTIYNNNYSVKIGNDVYQITGSGIYKNGVLQDDGGSAGIMNNPNNLFYAGESLNLKELVSGPMMPLNYTALEGEIFGGYNTNFFQLPTPCKSNKKKKETASFNNNTRRMDFKIAIHSIVIRSSVKAKAVSFKKKNGHWKRARTKMAVGCGGTVYQGDCSSSFQFNDRNPYNDYKKRKQLKVAYRSQAQVPGNETIWKTYTNLIAGTVDAPDLSFAATVFLTF